MPCRMILLSSLTSPVSVCVSFSPEGLFLMLSATDKSLQSAGAAGIWRADGQKIPSVDFTCVGF